MKISWYVFLTFPLLQSINTIDFDGVMLSYVKILFSSNEFVTILTVRWSIASFPVAQEFFFLFHKIY